MMSYQLHTKLKNDIALSEPIALFSGMTGSELAEALPKYDSEIQPDGTYCCDAARDEIGDVRPEYQTVLELESHFVWKAGSDFDRGCDVEKETGFVGRRKSSFMGFSWVRLIRIWMSHSR